MIASGSDYLARWRSGVYPVRQKAEIFIPVPIIAAAASGEDSSDWPASAVYDADRTHINAGPGPLAPNFIGRGEWKSPSVQSGSVQFTMNKRVQWRGTPYVVNTYHDAILGTWYSALPGKEPYRKIHGFWPLGDYGSPSYTSAATLRDVMANYSLAGDGYYIADTPIPGPSNRVDTLGYPTMIAGKGSLNSKSSLKSPGGETVRGFTPALLPYERYDDPTRYDFTWTWWVKNVTGSTILLLWQTPGGSPGTRPVWTVVVAPTTVQATYDPPAGLPLTSLVCAPTGTLNLNDGKPHRVSLNFGKWFSWWQLGPMIEIYVDGVLVAIKPVPFNAPPSKFIPGGVPQIGPGAAEISNVSYHNWSLMGAEQPDESPGIAWFNREKALYRIGITGETVTPEPTNLDQTVLDGQWIGPGGSVSDPYVSVWDDEPTGATLDVADTQWTRLPPGSFPADNRRRAFRAVADDTVVPPGLYADSYASGRSMRFWSNPQETYLLIPSPSFGIGSSCSYWNRALPAGYTKGILTARVRASALYHFQIEAWQGSPSTGHGFKVSMHESDHKWHVSLNAPASSQRFIDHIYAGDGTASSGSWAANTWYTIHVSFDSGAGTVKLYVDGVLAVTVAGFSLTTGIDRLRVFSHDDTAVPGTMSPSGVQEVFHWIHGLRILSGSFQDESSIEVMLDTGGAGFGTGTLWFGAGNFTDGTHRPYWTFEAAYVEDPDDPGTYAPIYTNPSKLFTATATFTTGGSRYVRIRATYHTDGADDLFGNHLEYLKVKIDQSGVFIVIRVPPGSKVGRFITYANPDLGGMDQFQIQRGDSFFGPWTTITDIDRVQAFEKWNGQSDAEFDAQGVVTLASVDTYVPSVPGASIVDLKQNYENEFYRFLITDPGTADGKARLDEIECYRRDDVSDLVTHWEFTHEADSTLDGILSRHGVMMLKNPRDQDSGRLLFTRTDFERAVSGQTSVDMRPELVVRVQIENEWKQIGWMAIDQPHLLHQSQDLSLEFRGRHEWLLFAHTPALWREGIHLHDALLAELAGANVSHAFYGIPSQSNVILPIFAPLRTAWDECVDLKEAMGDPGMHFNTFGILIRSQPSTLTPLETFSLNLHHRFEEHLSSELAGENMVAQAIEVNVHSYAKSRKVVYTETAGMASATPKYVSLDEPVDPLTLNNNNTAIFISRTSSRQPKIASSVAGAVLLGDAAIDTVAISYQASPSNLIDDPSRLSVIKIDNPWVVQFSQVQEISLRRLRRIEKGALGWAEGELPISPHIEYGDAFYFLIRERGMISGNYVARKVSHQYQSASDGATYRTQTELEQYIPPIPPTIRYRDLEMSADPTFFLRLGETGGVPALDETGKHNGSYVGSPTHVAGLLTGDSNGAMGTGGGVVMIPDSTAFDQPSFSVGFWVETLAASGLYVIVCQEPYGGANLWEVAIVANQLTFAVIVNNAGFGHTAFGPALNDGVRHYCAVTKDGAARRAIWYIDGLEVGRLEGASVPAGATQARDVVTIGGLGHSDGSYAFMLPSGAVDEAIYFPRVLSPEEIAARFAAGTAAV